MMFREDSEEKISSVDENVTPPPVVPLTLAS
jgi:hypothetical protein